MVQPASASNCRAWRRLARSELSPSVRGGSAMGPKASGGMLLRKGSDRKSTRLNSSHTVISYAVFCLKKKKHTSELQSHSDLVCRLLLEKKKKHHIGKPTISVIQPIFMKATHATVCKKSYNSSTTTYHKYVQSYCRIHTHHYQAPCSYLTHFHYFYHFYFLITFFFFFNDTATTEIYTLSLHDALFFFFEEHAPHLHSPFSLPRRLPL